MTAPEAFEKWWQSVRLGGFMNNEIMPDHVREAFDLGVMFARAECLAAVEATISDHDKDTPGGWCAANAARHAADAIRNCKE